MFIDVVDMSVSVPEGVSVSVDGSTVHVKGPKGEISKEFSKRAKVSVQGNEVVVEAKPALKGTIEAVVRNMIKGVTEGHVKKLKVLYAHFPITVEVKGKEIIIKNFLGEKQPRKTKIHGDAKVEVKGQLITVSGIDKEAVGQTAANLKSAVKIKGKDIRVFQDGIYEVE